MSLYYAGLNASSIFLKDEGPLIVIPTFKEVSFSGITDMEIGWNYFLLWQGKDLYITGKFNNETEISENEPMLLQIPEKNSGSYVAAVAGKEAVLILTTNNDIWQYKIYKSTWRKAPNFIPNNNTLQSEYSVKILQGGCTVVLTNLGRVFNVPTLVEMPKRVKFVDIACGFDHTILLAENGDVYSMGIGTRGQLGHGDLEDCDTPRLVEALAGLKVIQISAGGWHNAVVTDQGDLYTWGWNTNGELGIPDKDSKVVAVPTLISFVDERKEDVVETVKKVQCGNVFSICMMEDGTLWGCGSNKYGQLGQSHTKMLKSDQFVKLDIDVDLKQIKSFKCREWGTVILTN